MTLQSPKPSALNRHLINAQIRTYVLCMVIISKKNLYVNIFFEYLFGNYILIENIFENTCFVILYMLI